MSDDFSLRLEDASVAYGDEVVVHDVNLELAAGELHVLLGDSGSGKTTVLRAIAGFEPFARGRILLHGEVADDGRRRLPPEARQVGVVFQDYALFPHLDVGENVAFSRRLSAAETGALLARVGLGGKARSHVSDLSGGEQQRVALARALAQDPRLILFDEPFSNLNRELRRSLREATVAILRERGIPALFVTHDAEEAFAVADRVSVLHRGRLLQTGSPRELYQRPRSLEVARSVGDAETLTGRPAGDGAVSCALGEVSVRPPAAEGATETMVLVLRPEQIRLRAEDGGEGARAQVLARRWLGPSEEIEVELESGERLRARTVPGSLHGDASSVRVWVEGPAVCVARR